MKEGRTKILVTVGEAADLLSIGKTRLYELIASGELPSVVIGKSRRVRVAALEDLAKRWEQETDE